MTYKKTIFVNWGVYTLYLVMEEERIEAEKENGVHENTLK
jgi:hypothetical protein